MLTGGLAVAALVPAGLRALGPLPRPGNRSEGDLLHVLAFLGCVFASLFAILMTLDRLSRRVVADHPSKRGARVSAVGKWKS